MFIFKTINDIQAYLRKSTQNGEKVGFTPTMGALHSGHLSLISRAKAENDFSVCSIFVNPTQFNDPTDLEKYPRPIEQDIQLLISAGCDILFLPDVAEMYPPGLDVSVKVNLGGLDQVLEGPMRPGHFDGMVTIVHRLLDIVQPYKLYMGLKDYQQQAIIGQMIDDLQMPIELIPCESIREADGLAMSSRNARLSAEWRAKAPLIYQVLNTVAGRLDLESISSVEASIADNLSAAEFKVEYISIVDAGTLQEISSLSSNQNWVALVAVWAGDVRLIDNIAGQSKQVSLT